MTINTINLTQENIIQNIQSIKEDSLLDKLLSYIEENDFDIIEIGELLSKNDQFKRLLWIDTVNHNQILDTFTKDLLRETKDLDIW